MIRSFRCRETERISLGGVSRDFPPDIQTRARNKLVFLDKARDLDDLR
jgi:proteic killer suppression protein